MDIISRVDRYHRIAQKLHIQEEISWPALSPFFQGINDALELQYMIRFDLKSLDDDSKCWYDIHITNM
jgi:hypothetical protein